MYHLWAVNNHSFHKLHELTSPNAMHTLTIVVRKKRLNNQALLTTLSNQTLATRTARTQVVKLRHATIKYIVQTPPRMNISLEKSNRILQ